MDRESDGRKKKQVFWGGTERVEVYDWLRLIATILVVIGHSGYLCTIVTYGGVTYELPEMVSSAYYSPILSFLIGSVDWIYGFHMPLFFMLSGALLGNKPIPQYDHFVISKVKRLLIPYFLWGWLFMFPVKYAGNFYNAESIYQAMRGFLSGEDSGHLWFLTALFWCMICFALIQKVLVRKTDSVYILLLISGVISLTYAYLPFDILGLKRGLSYIFWFAMGYVFEYGRKSHVAWNIKQTILTYIILVMIEMLHVKHGVLNNFFEILCGAFLTFLLADMCSRAFANFSKTRVWKIIARNLFYVYLFHDPLEYIVLRIFFDRNMLETSLGCYAYVFCRTVLIFILSVLLGEGVRVVKGRGSIIMSCQ